MIPRFIAYTANSVEELVLLLNSSQTIFSSVVFFGKQDGSELWTAVLDYAFHPVITPDLIEELEERSKERSNNFRPTLAA